MTLPTVATLWIGPSLSWIEQLSLTSFVAAGHRTKLYCYEPVEGVPQGVEVADANQFFQRSQDLIQNAGPSMTADLFRLHLMQQSDEVWVDSDMIAIRPLTLNENGFAIGYERQGQSVCNAVLRAPRDSASIKLVLDFVNDPHHEPPWLRPVLRAKLKDVPKENLLSKLYSVKRSSLGPQALTYALNQTGEISEVHSPHAFFSVPWQFSDVLFNPYGGTEGWMTEETQAVHLWSFALSGYHKSHQPHPTSFVGQMQTKLGIDVSHLKRHL